MTNSPKIATRIQVGWVDHEYEFDSYLGRRHTKVTLIDNLHTNEP